MSKTSRALRRHHRARMFSRALKKHSEWWYEDPEGMSDADAAWILWRARRTHSNMQACSCSACCNERRNPWLTKRERLTIQEKKELERYQYELKELNASSSI